MNGNYSFNFHLPELPTLPLPLPRIHEQPVQAPNARLTVATTAEAAALALTGSTRPAAVIVLDSSITSLAHQDTAARLVTYTQTGGRVVLGGQLSANFDNIGGEAFWQRWGVPWMPGMYRSARFTLNPAGVPTPLDAHALDVSGAFKATFIRGADPRDAVYIIDPAARLPSHVACEPGVRSEVPAVWKRIGQGYLGYCGAVNTEVETTKLLVEMCGVRVGPKTFKLAYDPIAHTYVGAKAALPLAPAPGVQLALRVAARAVARRNALEVKTNTGALYKDKGDRLFKEGEYAIAAEWYREAARHHAPKPVYLTSLAAALIKIERWEAAESAADRALRGDPANLKARYRRGVARKGQKKYLDAIRDFRCVLYHEPTSEDAQRELDATLPLLFGQTEDEDYEDPPFDDSRVWEVATQSDTDDYKHTAPSNKPCQAYNHAGCARGTACPYVHAPDWRSARDAAGRNVCLWWLLGDCVWDDFYAGGCPYAHDDAQLPSPWWSKEYRLKAIEEEFRELDSDEEIQEIDRVFWKHSVMSWRADLWEEDHRAIPSDADQLSAQSGYADGTFRHRDYYEPSTQDGYASETFGQHDYYADRASDDYDDYGDGQSEEGDEYPAASTTPHWLDAKLDGWIQEMRSRAATGGYVGTGP
ncbi:hypothetical protein CERSUDRAFT_96226 [Gelatoporia subvermispora B]|uniref:C3H1-type domain-containing protein n=1 Tax=Ceriporiopsis subvermispora (strain B) TaxID=914234 RepID=M2QG38_CERS8|nr:hypothetical protein CERSUDRAFT_96226 [Gelatoporia subvermispora B]